MNLVPYMRTQGTVNHCREESQGVEVALANIFLTVVGMTCNGKLGGYMYGKGFHEGVLRFKKHCIILKSPWAVEALPPAISYCC